jgi:hypothetical protein
MHFQYMILQSRHSDMFRLTVASPSLWSTRDCNVIYFQVHLVGTVNGYLDSKSTNQINLNSVTGICVSRLPV